MSYSIEYKIQEDILIAEISNISPENNEANNILKALSEIANSCHENKFNKVMLVWQINLPFSPHEAIIIISNLAYSNWKKEYTTASVHPFKVNYQTHSEYTSKAVDSLDWNIKFFQDIKVLKNGLLQPNN